MATVEVKYLGTGEAVLVVGDGPLRSTSLDGGRTLEEVDQVWVARLPIELLEAQQLLDERPELHPDTGLPVVAEIVAPSVAATPAPQLTAEQLQAQIDALQLQKSQVLTRTGYTPEPVAEGQPAAQVPADPQVSDTSASTAVVTDTATDTSITPHEAQPAPGESPAGPVTFGPTAPQQ